MSLHAGRIKFGNGSVPTIQQHLSPLALNLRYHGCLLCARLWLRSRSCPGAYSSYLVARPVRAYWRARRRVPMDAGGGLAPAHSGPRGALGVLGPAKDGFL